MRKYICFITAILLALLPGAAVNASYENAAGVCVIEAKSGEVVFEKNGNSKLPMASTTKIMTAIIAIENSGLDDVVTVSKNAESQTGSSAYLYAGDEITMRDLLYGLMLNSGNDAAVAIAEYIAGSSEAFADMMNSKAWEMGAENTQFTNPNGLPDDYHYTTARDLALIARYAMQNKDFREIVSAKSFAALVQNTGRVIEYFNHNRLLGEYDGCTGVKTGYTNSAGRCLVSAAERDNLEFIAVTLNDPDDWADHKEFLDTCFNSYTATRVITAGDTASAGCVYADDFYAPVRNGTSPKFKVRKNAPKRLKAPVNKGEKIGYADIYSDGELIGSVDIIAAEDVYETAKPTDEPQGSEKKSFWKTIEEILKKFLF